MPSRSDPGGVNFFPNSCNAQINKSSLTVNVHAPIGAQKNNYEHLHILDAEVATNAILNAGGRVDIPKCHPGTREQVISLSEKWMSEGYREDRHIFWLSGPAGAGKSAIVQTLAERCIERGVLMGNFFFFRADGSRNHSRPVVATLLRQLMKSLPELKALVNDVIAEDNLIFKTSLREQFMTLLDGPIRKLFQATPNALPVILLIDGLDECDSRVGLDDATTSEQRNLLNALHELVTRPGSLFVVLVASRAEPHIVMDFNSIGRHRDSIYLDGDYHPEQDIQLFVTTELRKIKHTHSLGQLLSVSWPSDSIINTVVERSSGQFIYAATIVRFIANSPESPAFTMDMVLNARPSHNHSPFGELDAIYMFILSRSKHWEQASGIIAVHAILGGDKSTWPFPPRALGYSEDETRSFFSDLTSIIQATISAHRIDLTFYHASFNDFISSPMRAGRFNIGRTNTSNPLAPQLILAISDHTTFVVAMNVVQSVNQRSPALTDALTCLPTRPLDVDWEGQGWIVKDHFLPLVKEMYAQHDPDLYRQIFNHMKWQDWIPADVHLSDTLDLCDKLKRQHWFQRLFQ